MPKPPQSKRLSAGVIAARAGLIPASDWIDYELEVRVGHIARAVGSYAKRSRGRDDLAITDILQDLRHYCDSKGLAFGDLDEKAREYYREDVNQSPWIRRPSAT
jgi:hypothetical protein